MKRKNLLYVFADQWRASALGFAGKDPVCTPHMDMFAARCVTACAVSSYPLCSPHRAALLTGKHPLACGFWTNCKAPMPDSPDLKDSEVCISDVLKAAGWQTCYVGKWHLQRSETNDSPAPASGARNWDAYTPPGKGRHGFDFWHSYGAWDQHLEPHYWEDSPEMIQVREWSPAHETDVLLDWLSGAVAKRDPFCAFLSWNPPHPPYDKLPEELQERYIRPSFEPNVPEAWRKDSRYLKAYHDYFAAVEGLDGQWGRIMSFLDEHQLWDDTIIVLSADHGDMMGSHGLYGKNVWYEESIAIPWYLYDACLAPGSRDVLLASEDQAPTLLSLLGVPVPPCMTGLDQSPALRQDLRGKREAVYLTMIPGMPEQVEPYRKRGMDNKRYGWRGVRTRKWLYLHHKGTQVGEAEYRLLYDLEHDPYEMRPCQPDERQVARFEGWMRGEAKKIGDLFYEGE